MMYLVTIFISRTFLLSVISVKMGKFVGWADDTSVGLFFFQKQEKHKTLYHIKTILHNKTKTSLV